MNDDKNKISKNSKVRNCNIGRNVKIYDNADLFNCTIGDSVTVGNDTNIVDSELNGNISINRRNYILRSRIGKFTYTGIGTMIRSCKVGNFCSISWNVSIGGGDHPNDKVATSTLNRFYLLDAGYWDHNSKKELNRTFKNQQQCLVGNDVLISSNVIILRDIKIGNGAVLGAGAVITKDVEPYSVVVGIPAAKIKMRFDDKTIERLEQIQWWKWPTEIIRNNLELIYSQKVDNSILDKLEAIADSL